MLGNTQSPQVKATLVKLEGTGTEGRDSIRKKDSGCRRLALEVTKLLGDKNRAWSKASKGGGSTRLYAAGHIITILDITFPGQNQVARDA